MPATFNFELDVVRPIRIKFPLHSQSYASTFLHPQGEGVFSWGYTGYMIGATLRYIPLGVTTADAHGWPCITTFLHLNHADQI